MIESSSSFMQRASKAFVPGRPTTPAVDAVAVVEEAEHKKDLTTEEQEASLFYIVMFSSVGTILEWIDFSLYAFLAKQVGHAFFPPADARTQLMESFTVFGGAYLVRPLGGIIFGWIGDVISNKVAIQVSILLMAFSTTGMGVLPTYAHIGIAAPILLTILRLLQGLAVGGQLVGTMVYINQYAPPNRKGFYGGLALSGAMLGILVGSLIGSIMFLTTSPADIKRFAFRVPFLCGWVVALAGYCLHTKVPNEVPMVDEDPAAVDGQVEEGLAAQTTTTTNTTQSSSRTRRIRPKDKPAPINEVLAGHKLEVLLALCVTALWSSAFYIVFVWLATYFTTLVDKPIKNGFLINSWWLLVLTLALPGTGHLADRIGYKKVMITGAAVLVVGSVPAFHIMKSGNIVGCFFGQGVLTVGLSYFAGPLTVYLTNKGVALVYNISIASLGGSAPLLATAIYPSIHGLGVGLWISCIAAFSLIALLIDPPSQTNKVDKGEVEMPTLPIAAEEEKAGE